QLSLKMILCRFLFHTNHITWSFKIFSTALHSRSCICHFGRFLSTKVNHYTILGIDRNATTEDVRNAFLSRSKECHPDINIKNSVENHQQFILVNEAYSVLSKPSSRQKYDLTLQNEEHLFNSSVNQAHSSTTRDDFYEHPRAFHDIHSVKRDAQRSHNRPYYGIPGINKVSNSRIVVACLSLMLVGIILHLIVVSYSFSKYQKALDKNDAKISAMLQSAKDKANKLLEEDLLRNLQQKSLVPSESNSNSNYVPKNKN
ncbi:dnaJ subfamily C member 4, partial [Biomphalaria glabrata]